MICDFLVESEELLQGMDQDMVSLESSPQDADLLNRIFRALHTIKGTAGFLGFDPVVRLSHSAEDVLNDLRRNEIQASQRLTNCLLASRDQLGVMLQDIRGGGLKSYELSGLVEELAAVRHREIATQSTATAPAEPTKNTEPAASSNPSSEAPKTAPTQSSVDASPTMRVEVRKLDELMNLIGELVLERNRLVRLAGDLNLDRLDVSQLRGSLGQSTARLSFITEELQSAGLKARMVPIDSVFRKFPRMVRDMSNGLKKEVELVVRGQETEVDKTVVELIGDPLVHLIRNALDHGVEQPDARIAAGKKRVGTIRLDARQEGDQILVSVSDDGAGMDPSRILRKAVEKGLISAERSRSLSKREIFDFIFLPGFSTVDAVSDLSGRGVGMDVVRSNLKRINGSIDLDSTLGQGSTVLLRLPLTLAILPVLLVRIGSETYGLPLRSVIETSQIRLDEIHQVEGREVLLLRGSTLALLRLENAFSSPSEHKGPAGQVVILAVGEKRLALAVDQLIGQESTVIKPLGPYLQNCSGIAGATISGEGRVRLVLDPAGLLLSASRPASKSAVQ